MTGLQLQGIYTQYKSAPFKIAESQCWTVVVHHEHLEEKNWQGRPSMCMSCRLWKLSMTTPISLEILESWISEETLLSLIVPGRDPDWIDLNVRTTVDALKGDIIVALFTKFMRRLVARFTNSSHLHRTLYEQCMRKLTPMSAKWLLRPSVPSDDNTAAQLLIDGGK
ncbi:hypothetical protein EV363DRAFT_1300354 [Boletus edulis]|nr:hypothetical protein EV363DRAFT_1300354 [Boletus edulis]